MMATIFTKKISMLLGILLSVASTLVWAGSTTINKMQVVRSGDYVRIIMSMTEAHQCDVFPLNNPNRVVVDLEGAKLNMNLNQVDLPRDLIKQVRSGHPSPGTLRIVFDVAAVVPLKSFLAPIENNQESQLVIDLYYPASHPIAKITPPKQQPVRHPAPASLVAKVKSSVVMPRQKKLYVPVSETLKSQTTIVMIDAGHGGKDSGTIGPHGTREKDVVLGIALRLARLINQVPSMHAVLTRDGDYFVSLGDRLAMTRKSKADLFIAIHADSYFNNQLTGASVYALSHHGASSVAARWLADKENHSELGGVDLNELSDKSVMLRSVLIDLAQTATITDSMHLGSDLLVGLETMTKLHDSQVEQAPFMVLKSPDIPSVLLETGFLSNPKEEERLRDKGYRDKLARALLDGIQRYVASHPPMVSNRKSASQSAEAQLI